MRRFALAALSGALMLSACDDQSPQPPTGPQTGGQPTFDKGVPCGTPAFPLSDANILVKLVYPNGTPENNALAKVFDISKRWSQCKVADPRGKVVEFVKVLYGDWIAQPSRLTPQATAQKVGELINLMYSGVGLSAGDFGYGLYTGPELRVRGDNNTVGTIIPAGGFGTEPTVVTITRLPDTPQLVTGGFDQFPPFYDITVTNASGTHNLVAGFGIVGFCVTQAVLDQITANDGDPQIGHNPTDGGFEVLEAANTDEYANLGLSCIIGVNTVPVITDLFRGGSVGNLALGTWNAASQSVASAAQAILLPQPLQAATIDTKGIGGRTTKYSPFGVVDAFSGSD